MGNFMNFYTKNGINVFNDERFHMHASVTFTLLSMAIMEQSGAIEQAFELKKRLTVTHSFPQPIGVSHCVPCPPHSKGVYFKKRGNRPYLSRMVIGQPLPTNNLTMIFYPEKDSMKLITAWIGDKACPEIGNISRFEEEENPVESLKEAVDFWMTHALIEV